MTEHSTTTFRTRALTERVTRRAVRRWYRPFAEQHPSVRSPLTPARRVAAFVGGGAAVIGLLALGTGVAQEVDAGRPDMVGQLLGISVIGGLLLIAGIVLAWFYVRTTARRGTPTRHYRLARFAAQNVLTYRPGPVSGAHITPWADRGSLSLTRVMRTASRRPLEFANYELRTSPAGSRNTQFGGFCAVRLSTSLPHIILQARGGALFSAATLPASSQRLSLEGNFDDYFTLYCPTEYERDALYLFTPDVMARLIDRVRGFDVEIIDDWLFFVTSRDVVTLNPATWQGLADATSALSDKIGRWERWRDDRLPEVAPDSTVGADAGAQAGAVGADAGAQAGAVGADAGAQAGAVGASSTVGATTEAPIGIAGTGLAVGAGAPAGVTAATATVAKPGRRLRMSLGARALIWAVPVVVLLVLVVLANLL
ncbi:hypothetical protein [Cryobacterium sp. PAMC25264]|uniref:hypothetical protein n=1 Tax=Cryobacterium sp. PAMC25264 TaxID=2861288 RepID=UPI001C637470|nr:hypothetical protein [Cryobacterium sp. PAMC25264]QYF72388.1 hypothetical protein KY500_11080 [Cryobacterium sp. PAMC25264]